MPMAGTHQSSAAHQPRDPHVAMPLATRLQISMNAWCSIRLTRRRVHRPHLFQ